MRRATYAAILLAVSAVILFGTGAQPVQWRWAGFVAVVLVGGTAAATSYRDPSSRRFLPATMLIGALSLVFLALSGTRL